MKDRKGKRVLVKPEKAPWVKKITTVSGGCPLAGEAARIIGEIVGIASEATMVIQKTPGHYEVMNKEGQDCEGISPKSNEGKVASLVCDQNS